MIFFDEIPPFVRNDSMSIYIGMGKSSGIAAAFSHPLSTRKRPSFRLKGEISSNMNYELGFLQTL